MSVGAFELNMELCKDSADVIEAEAKNLAQQSEELKSIVKKLGEACNYAFEGVINVSNKESALLQNHGAQFEQYTKILNIAYERMYKYLHGNN